MSGFNPRNEFVVQMLDAGKTMQEIAGLLYPGCTRERVRQLERRGREQRSRLSAEVCLDEYRKNPFTPPEAPEAPEQRAPVEVGPWTQPIYRFPIRQNGS